MINILYLYNSSQTFTSTVFEHISGFQKFSRFRSFFCHHDRLQDFNVDLSLFDVVFIHYTIRLPYDEISQSAAIELEKYPGLKCLFIQDEYDHTCRAWYWIKRLGIQLVFTVVPREGIQCVYPPAEFPGVRFVNNLTGYVPMELSAGNIKIPPSQRKLIVGYRGRPLPIRYGDLGQEKIRIGRLTKRYCEKNGISHDIAWAEEKRIYGPKWPEFIASCRAMLGSESGSNVFDLDGALVSEIEHFLETNPGATDDIIYRTVVQPRETPGLMNQVSPRIFEAIASRTVLVLFEGEYSGVVKPDLHYISLQKDGGNLDEVFAKLNDANYVDTITERAYQDVIAAGKYSYQSFVRMVDEEITKSIETGLYVGQASRLNNRFSGYHTELSQITTFPFRAELIQQSSTPSSEPITPVQPQIYNHSLSKRVAIYFWLKLPCRSKRSFKANAEKALHDRVIDIGGISMFVLDKPLVNGLINKLLDADLACKSHRGSDGSGHGVSSEGCVGLGRVCLSIIGFETGALICSDDGRFTIIYNGAIYN